MWFCYSLIMMPAAPVEDNRDELELRLTKPQSMKRKEQETGACRSVIVQESTQIQREETKNTEVLTS